MNTNIYQLCSYLYSSFYIPIIHVSENQEITYEFPESPNLTGRDSMLKFIKSKFVSQKSPDIFALSSSEFYGKVTIKNSENFLIIGPLYNDSYLEKKLTKDFSGVGLQTPEYRGLDELGRKKKVNLNNMVNLLAFINYLLNHEIITIADHFDYLNMITIERLSQRKVMQTVQRKENDILHNTYFLEQEIFKFIREGRTKQLISFLVNKAGSFPVRAGKMAESPLRQAKNIFLATVTKVGNQSAIPGGMDIQEAYELMDIYSLECEKLDSISEITKLHYTMLINFCDQVKKSSGKNNISLEVQRCINFINNRTNMLTTLDDVADFAHRSKSYINQKFKQEIGVTIGRYIIESKLNESRDLLAYSSMTISEISNYLGFSSQSYFQNQFRKQFNITPGKYRKNPS